MTDTTPVITSRDDVRRISAAPYRDFMPHRRVLAALENVAARHPERTALSAIDVPDPAAEPRRWTYTRLVQDVRRAANLFHSLAGDVFIVEASVPMVDEQAGVEERERGTDCYSTDGLVARARWPDVRTQIRTAQRGSIPCPWTSTIRATKG